VFDATHEGFGQLAAAAGRLRNAVAVDETRHQVQAETRAEFIGHLKILRHQSNQPDPDLFTFE
jgi:hypothetical protein